MKINIGPYILGLVLQAVFIAIMFIGFNYFHVDTMYQALAILAVGETTLITVLAKTNSSLLLGFATGMFTAIIFVSMIIVELIIHPPSEE